MPDNNVPSAKPNPATATGEFDFAAPITERPRVKRRALQDATKPVVEVKAEKVVEAAPARPSTPATAAKPAPATKPAAATTAPVKTVSSTASTASQTAAKTATPAQSTSPHGTRPATLYYSSGPRPEKATTPFPMKSTPAASPSPSASASSTSTPRTTAASATRPASSVVDYRTNVDRQSREQKSVGGILSILVYTLIALFVLGASLATYGAFVITKQLDRQSVTMNDFDKRYATDYKDVNARLASTQDTLAQAQAQIGRQQELITKQQDTINKMLSAMDDTAAAIRQEKAIRATETANIRAHIKDLEYSGTTTRKY